MPISGPTTLDAVQLDSVLTLDVDTGLAEIDLSRVSFVDAYALTGLACFIASADRDGLSVELVLPEHPDVRSWLSRMISEPSSTRSGSTSSAEAFRGWPNATGETP